MKPDDFILLNEIDPTIIENTRYATADNFLGTPVDGYAHNKIICTKQAAQQLKKAHDDFKKQGYLLVVYDGYRPQRAVDAFMKWCQISHDQIAKMQYYPTIDKKDLFNVGYLAEKSGHSRGSTFDLTLIPIDQMLKPIVLKHRKLTNGEEIPFLDDNTVDMGASFDLFHEVSHHDSPLVTREHNAMRDLLRETMKRHGFGEYLKEWWHYTLKNEPYPDTYFDFIFSP